VHPDSLRRLRRRARTLGIRSRDCGAVTFIQRFGSVEAGTRRLRPIFLTSITTFLGLAPMLLERSMQARFLIPMAISLAFGVLFATLVIPLLVPCLYLIAERFRRVPHWEQGRWAARPSGRPPGEPPSARWTGTR
jgi:hypothetical protein